MYPFPNCDGYKFEDGELISHFTPQFIMDVIPYPYRHKKYKDYVYGRYQYKITEKIKNI